MAYKKIDSTRSQSPDYYAQKPRFQHHGAMAGVLIVLGLLFRFGIPLLLLTTDTQPDSSGVMIGTLLGAAFWIWGCFHLTLHFGLHYAWGFAGLLFLVGIGIIFWAANQKPKWDRQRAIQTKRPKEYRGDPDSLY
jgi:hypothetical protein